MLILKSQFMEFVGIDVIIAHNADFDMKFLLNNGFVLRMEKIRNEVIDTLPLSRKYTKDINRNKLVNYKLMTLKKSLEIVVSSHNAGDDCLFCAEVYKKCKEKIQVSLKPKKENIVVYNKTFSINKLIMYFWNVLKIY